MTITDQEISGVESTELTPGGWTIREEGPTYETGGVVELDTDQLADGIKDELLGMADRLLEYAGHSSQFKGRVYRILLGHVRMKFLDGTSLGACRKASPGSGPQNVAACGTDDKGCPGLIEGMVNYGD